MLHYELRELLVCGYEAANDANGIARAYSVSERAVCRLVEQRTGSAALRQQGES